MLSTVEVRLAAPPGGKAVSWPFLDDGELVDVSPRSDKCPATGTHSTR